jgi:NADPH2:quinone reductase
VQRGETILIHAAAGGVGLIVCQWAKHLGATVIGTVGDDEKATLAKNNGCDQPIVYRREDFVARVAELTQGKKLPVVYDSVGKDTFYKSLDCLAPLGLMVSFGQSSGAIGPVDIGILAAKGSLFLTRPTLVNYTATREDLLTASRELFEVVQTGAVKIAINQTYPLREAARAHRDLQDRKTTGRQCLPCRPSPTHPCRAGSPLSRSAGEGAEHSEAVSNVKYSSRRKTRRCSWIP